MEADAAPIPAIEETPGYHLIRAIEYWGALTSEGVPLGPIECEAIAKIERLSPDEARQLRALSIAFSQGFEAGGNPLGIPPRYEDYQND